jgi:Protein of unknown function (DUF3631)
MRGSMSASPHVRAEFTDEAGELLFQEVEQNGNRWVRRPDGNGGWIANVEGCRRVLWNLPALHRHLSEGVHAGPIYLTEGTSDAQALAVHLEQNGLRGIVTTNPFGALSWLPEFTECLTGAVDVIAVVDVDDAGRKRAALLERELDPYVERLQLLRTPLDHKGADLRDHLEAGLALGDLVPAGDAPIRMVALPELLEQVGAFIRSYVVLPTAAIHYLALFVAHTYVMGASETTAYVYITGPVRRIGKSRARETLEYLVQRPRSTVSISEAALFRVIGADDTPTLLFDEIEALFGPNAQRDPAKQMLVAILNAGWRRRGGEVLRCVGEGSKQSVVAFPVYGPKVLVGIDVGLPDTLADRVVRIEMTRRRRSEPVKRLRDREAQAESAPLRAQLERFAESAVDTLKEARPELPDELDDRKQDGWEPLFALAELAGGEWPARARAAALALSAGGEEEEDGSPSMQLLADLREAFRDDDRLATKELLERLTADEESRWREWGRQRKPLTAMGLGNLLRPFKIRSRSIRFPDGSTVKGYLRDQFADAWDRYLTPLSAFQDVTSSQAKSHAGLSATPRRHSVTASDARNPAWIKQCDGVTAENAYQGVRSRLCPECTTPDECAARVSCAVIVASIEAHRRAASP